MWRNVKTYSKIHTLWKRDSDNYNVIIPGDFALEEFERFGDIEWTVTEKVDGTNTRLAYNKGTGDLYILGKSTDSNLHQAQVSWFYDNRKELQDMFDNVYGDKDKPNEFVVIFGEIFGANVGREAKQYGDEARFRVFDIYEDQEWKSFKEVEELCTTLNKSISYRLLIPVELLGMMTLKEAEEFVLTKPRSRLGEDAYMEGVVCKLDGIKDSRGKRIITKIKYADYKRIGMCK